MRVTPAQVLSSVSVSLSGQPPVQRYLNENRKSYLDYTERKLTHIRLIEQAERWRKVNMDPALQGWADGFAQRYPQAAQYGVPLRYIGKQESALRGDPTVVVNTALGQNIEIYKNFWNVEESKQDYDVLRAIGEMLMFGVERYFTDDAQNAGIDPVVFTDAGFRAFGPVSPNKWPSFLDGFGRAFALYFTDESLLRRKYPNWYKLVTYFFTWGL